MDQEQKQRLAKTLRRASDRLMRLARMLGAEAIRLTRAAERATQSSAVDESKVEPSAELYRGEVLEVFGHYCKVMGRRPSQYKLTPARAKKIKARLREGFDLEQLKRAATNMSKSDFHMGKNDAGRRYNDLANNLFSSYERAEEWVEGRPVEARLKTNGRKRREKEEAWRQGKKRRREDAAADPEAYAKAAQAIKKGLEMAKSHPVGRRLKRNGRSGG